MEIGEKALLDDVPNASENIEVITINEADLSEIKNLLEKQVIFLEQEKKEQLEKEELLLKEQEEQLKEQEQQEKELEELSALEEEEKTQQTETVNTIAQNIESTAFALGEQNEQLTELITKLELVIENQESQKVVSVESGWMITLSIALAVALKVFWDHVLKW